MGPLHGYKPWKFPTLCALFITMRFKKSWHLPNGTEIYEFEVLRLAHLETFRNAELHSLFFFSALNSKSDQESSMLKQDRMKDPKMKGGSGFMVLKS